VTDSDDSRQRQVTPRRKHRRVRVQGNERAGDWEWSFQQRETTDGQPRSEDSNDERLKRDVPPHWG
jgi:hypothetical protein